ncbi:MAG: MBL fold metallo-hydrolase [Pseudomonadota bacterium]
MANFKTSQSIPFVADKGVVYGEPIPMSPMITRVVARNASPFTYTGTGTYLVGQSSLAVIDPGPEDPTHLAALMRAIDGRRVEAILITHTHRDHSPLALALKGATGAPIIGCAPADPKIGDALVDEGHDDAYQPDEVLGDGRKVSGDGWTMVAVATPGHADQHLCYAFAEEKALFTGDHVMGWATSVIAPPDGNMAAYFASLEKLLTRDDAIYYPTHGQPIRNPHAFVEALIAHRRNRESQIIDAIAGGYSTIPEMVPKLYADTAKALHGAAALSVAAHIFRLVEEGSLESDRTLSPSIESVMNARFRRPE